jgi:predicted protein tyrosine phosphatase
VPPPPLSFHWVLRQRLAIGPAPIHPAHLEQLERAGLRSILSLCSELEAPPPPGLASRFRCLRVVLADHRCSHVSTPAELLRAVHGLEQLEAAAAPVYVHCVASVERSPLVCIAWLMRNQGLSRLQALEYLMAIHPSSSPLPNQLQLLDAISSPPLPQR